MTYDGAVKLATVPNTPLAELWSQRLRQNGIEAFYDGWPTQRGLRTAIWVPEREADRARKLFPELK